MKRSIFIVCSVTLILTCCDQRVTKEKSKGNQKEDYSDGTPLKQDSQDKRFQIPSPHSVVVPIPKLDPGDFSNKDIADLIDKLASRNPDPNPNNSPGVVNWDGYKKEYQIVVEKAEANLEALGHKAFPLLIASANDKRYSQSNYTATIQSFSVGEVCLDIISRQILDIPGRRSSSRISVAPDYKKDVFLKDPNQWWKDHAHLTLDGIKLNVARWLLEAERKNSNHHEWVMGISKENWLNEVIFPLERFIEKKEANKQMLRSR